MAVSVSAGTTLGRRRRPSGEPPPLPHTFGHHARRRVALMAAALAVTVALYFPPALAAVTSLDDTVVRWAGSLRVTALTDVARQVQALGSVWTIRIAAWGTIVALVTVRRFRHLAVYLAVFLGCSLIDSGVATSLGRMRPAGVAILGEWTGYAYPARPVTLLAVVLVGAVYTLLPGGKWRRRGRYAAVASVTLLSLSGLYLGAYHPTDLAAGLVLGWVVPAAVILTAAPEDAFPVTYRRGQRAHLDVGGRRGRAITEALARQLGMAAVSIRPFGLAGSAGSTPMVIHLAPGSDPAVEKVFAKLYALNHLRSDRWYKLARTVLYGRLEDEKPFSTVRRLTEYEDHMLRLLRDEGLPTPQPYGFVEITPEREYLIAMECFDAATEIGEADLDDPTIADGLAVVRKLWDSGVAHRDIKPSNLLVRDGKVLLIDVAFATVRPTPWRQAVDLANMMLTLALRSSPERVYQQALAYFSPEEIAEAVAASRSITIPSQLRARMKADGRDLLGSFRRLAPDHPPVAIQLWDLQRLFVTLAVLAGAVIATGAIAAYLQTASLL